MIYLLTMNAPRNNALEFCLLERRRREVDIAPALGPPLPRLKVLSNPANGKNGKITPRPDQDLHRTQLYVFEPTGERGKRSA
jgi:hypothetical protein